MTSNVKSGQQLSFGLHAVFLPACIGSGGASQDDGCSCCSPWGGSHLPCLRRVPASLSARGFISASSRPQGLPHPGAASRPMHRRSQVTMDGERFTVSCYGVSGPSWAMAPIKALSSRALATPTWLAFFPPALSWRERLQRRMWAFQLLSWLGLDPFSRRNGSCWLPVAG